MTTHLDIKIQNQPDLTSCGATSLHAVYKHLGEKTKLQEVIDEILQFDEGGGTFAVVLANHALSKGFKAKIYCFNINIFDPSWFGGDPLLIKDGLGRRLKQRSNSIKEKIVLTEYIRFLDNGGELVFCDLSSELLTSIIEKGKPIITGLSSTWLYRSERENPITNEYDAIEGDPAGHFVIIHGVDEKGNFDIADPYNKNPLSEAHYYHVGANRLVTSILLGVTSFDGNLLLLEKANN